MPGPISMCDERHNGTLHEGSENLAGLHREKNAGQFQRESSTALSSTALSMDPQNSIRDISLL